MKIYSPFNIEILLHYHTHPEPHTRIDVKSVRDFTNELLRLRVIVQTPENRPDTYCTTALGRCWVQALCNVKLPRHAYVDSEGAVLFIEPDNFRD